MNVVVERQEERHCWNGDYRRKGTLNNHVVSLEKVGEFVHSKVSNQQIASQTTLIHTKNVGLYATQGSIISIEHIINGAA